MSNWIVRIAVGRQWVDVNSERDSEESALYAVRSRIFLYNHTDWAEVTDISGVKHLLVKKAITQFTAIKKGGEI